MTLWLDTNEPNSISNWWYNHTEKNAFKYILNIVAWLYIINVFFPKYKKNYKEILNFVSFGVDNGIDAVILGLFCI